MHQGNQGTLISEVVASSIVLVSISSSSIVDASMTNGFFAVSVAWLDPGWETEQPAINARHAMHATIFFLFILTMSPDFSR